MDIPPPAGDVAMSEPESEHHIVKADEMDQTGTDISPISDDQLMEEVAQGIRQEQEQAEQAAPTTEPTQPEQPPKRPELRRDNSAPPPPPLQPPPPAPVQQNADPPTDSLSLAQLRKLVQEMPKIEQPAYAFEYADSQSFPDEIEEWFQYNEFDRVMLVGMKSTFGRQWTDFTLRYASQTPGVSWIEASESLRRNFVRESLDKTRHPDVSVRLEALENICYAVTGTWGSTAGRVAQDFPSSPDSKAAENSRSKSLQIEWIEQNVSLVQQCDGISVLVERLSQIFDKTRPSFGPDPDGIEFERLSAGDIAAPEREANLLLTSLYFTVEVGRRQEGQDPQCTLIRDSLVESKPCLLVSIVEIIARLRWDESANIPLTRIILLLWKTLLLVFGGTERLKRAKEVLEPKFKKTEEDSTNRRTPFLTASPLDYQTFRQEITSKYPAYNPPPALVPLELDNNSILPPLPQHPHKAAAPFCGVGPSVASGNGSILQQSVHIATPAPSPPPSPIGPGGKAGKKQNYQTNQNFPLMYPPLDDTSNLIGGKGSTERQDVLVGKRWEGNDVPASIIEAGRLFSTHVKMTRAMQQLWDERENFMKYDRGWNHEQPSRVPDYSWTNKLPEDMSHLDLDGSEQSSQTEPKSPKEKIDDPDIQRRLDAVEDFYVSERSFLLIVKSIKS